MGGRLGGKRRAEWLGWMKVRARVRDDDKLGEMTRDRDGYREKNA